MGGRKKDNIDRSRSTNVNVTPATGEILFSKETFAPQWLGDAKCEARVQGYEARRREIVFAQCFVESYLFEWVRDKVVKGAFGKIPNYLEGTGIRRKWKGAVKKVCEERSIVPPSWENAEYWKKFRRLVEYRDGLVHGQASWPTLVDPPVPIGPAPVPSKKTLESLPPGWAVEIVVELVRQLHKTIGAPPPSWL